ncbi:optineurin-like [Anopheles darlingi]|uniref:optineurin-like n=1 Tax=Anopheles darlingi TaxID=43151 RepID=UPI0021000E5F|nr:optineurin-like [Anopheles darlingi]
METDSERIRKRAETALAIAKDFILDEEDEDIEDENEAEDCHSDDALKDGIDDTFDAGATYNREQKELSDTKIDSEEEKHGKDDETLQEKKKWLSTIAGIIIRPIGARFKWNLNFNLDIQASNKKRNPAKKKSTDSNRCNDSSIVSQPTEVITKDKKAIIDDAAKIQNLTKENYRLVKLADIFLDECILLRNKNDHFCEEVNRLRTAEYDLERSREGLEAHLTEIKKLETALGAADAELSMIKQTFEKRNMEFQRVEQDYKLLTSKYDELASELTMGKQEHNRILADLRQQLQNMANEKSVMITKNESIIKEIIKEKNKTELNLHRAESEIRTLRQRAEELQRETAEGQIKSKAYEQNIQQLQRAIAVIESNQSSNTTRENSNVSFPCPICGELFKFLADMQLHVEDCNN